MTSVKSNRIKYFFVIIALIIIITACVTSKRYVGTKVNVNSGHWCKFENFPASCFQEDNAFLWEYTISKGNNEGEYILEGTMDGSSGSLKSFSRMQTSECDFAVILVKDNVVIDYIRFSPIGTDVSAKNRFSRTLKTAPFDAVVIDWKVRVSG